MTRGTFHKMHGLGNDFVVIDGRTVAVEMTTARAHAIADRKTGIGFDQLILLEPSTKADVKMRIFNADGGEVEACGNATRCIARPSPLRRLPLIGNSSRSRCRWIRAICRSVGKNWKDQLR
jgi:diaminopimelate epimerase